MSNLSVGQPGAQWPTWVTTAPEHCLEARTPHRIDTQYVKLINNMEFVNTEAYCLHIASLLTLPRPSANSCGCAPEPGVEVGGAPSDPQPILYSALTILCPKSDAVNYMVHMRVKYGNDFLCF